MNKNFQQINCLVVLCIVFHTMRPNEYRRNKYMLRMELRMIVLRICPKVSNRLSQPFELQPTDVRCNGKRFFAREQSYIVFYKCSSREI